MGRKQVFFFFLKFPDWDSETITECLFYAATEPVSSDMCDILYFKCYAIFTDEERV